jgi:TFIIF-interacting CTD phosphatase-like protein
MIKFEDVKKGDILLLHSDESSIRFYKIDDILESEKAIVTLLSIDAAVPKGTGIVKDISIIKELWGDSYTFDKAKFATKKDLRKAIIIAFKDDTDI